MKTYVLTFIFALCSLSASAQLLWKVSGNNAKSESYIFGTHHVAPYSITDSIRGFNDAINSVQTIIGEVNLANINQNRVQQLTMNHALAPTDSLLTLLLTTQQVDSLNCVLSKYTQGQLTAEMLTQLKPAMISTMLTLYQTSTFFPEFNQEDQLDGKILNLGHNLGKELDGFESLEEQLSFLFDSPLHVQAQQLMETVRHDSEAVDTAKNLAYAYMNQNLQKIEEIMSAEMQNESDFAKRLITDRNKRWLSKLESILPEKSAFIVVGCGHLPGKDGLLEGLKNKGYKVEAVK